MNEHTVVVRIINMIKMSNLNSGKRILIFSTLHIYFCAIIHISCKSPIRCVCKCGTAAEMVVPASRFPADDDDISVGSLTEITTEKQRNNTSGIGVKRLAQYTPV